MRIEVFSAVQKGSMLGSLLLNVFFNDLFLFTTNSSLSNYTGDTTLYASGQKLEEIKQIIHYDFEKVAKWFYESYMMLNQGKCHFMCLERNTENKASIFKNRKMKNSEEKIWALARL